MATSPGEDVGLSTWEGGLPEPEPEPELGAAQQAAAAGRSTAAEPELEATKHTVNDDGVLVEHRDLVAWHSPRLIQAMMQSGVEAEELAQKDEEIYLKQAIFRGEQLGWKSQKAVRQIAAQRYRRGELQRRKLLSMVLDIRQGLIDSNAEVSALISPSKKKVSIEDDEKMKAKLEEEAERRRRAMISEEQRAAAANERLDEQMSLKLAKEKEQLEVDKKFEQLKLKRAQEVHEKQQAMMLWQVELEKQRAAQEEEEREKAAAFEVARQKKDKELIMQLKIRKQEAAQKGLMFSKKQQAKVEKIQTQWKEKEARVWSMKVETEKKLLESERVRDLKRKKEAEARASAAARKSEELAQRLQQKRNKDEEDRKIFIEQSLQKHANVDAALAAKKAKKEKEIKEQQETTRRKEEERRVLAEERAAEEQKRLSAIIEVQTNPYVTAVFSKLLWSLFWALICRYVCMTICVSNLDIQARNEKNKVFDRVCEVNEERNVLKAEQHAMKFEETVSNIRRHQKAAEFRQAQLALEQQQKVERAHLLEKKKTAIAAERRYAAQQFLIEQERMREQLATSALNKSIEMANLSMGNVTKRCEASLEVTQAYP